MGFKELTTKVLKERPVTIAVAYPVKDEIFRALKEATDLGICSTLLIGDKSIIERNVGTFDLDNYRIITAENERDASKKAVEAVRNGDAQCLMKGHVATAILMKEVLNSEYGLKSGRLLSHIAVFEQKNGSFLGVTDGGLNISPDISEKADIIKNAVSLFRSLGVEIPKAAILSAVEVVNPAIPSTVEAAAIDTMAKRGQIKNAIIEGPLALDLAVSQRACELKGVQSKINGDADILVVPDIVSGNILGKSLIYHARFPSGGIILGAKSPIILLSRSDTKVEKLNSILLGISSANSV